MSQDFKIQQRLSGALVPEGTCSVYAKARNRHGYGVVRHGGRNWLAHRLAWTLANGPIPSGMRVCHSCDNPPCCNVQHLFLGTQADNNADKRAKGREWHPFKVSAEQRAEIASRLIRGRGIRHSNASELAQEFGISRHYVMKIAGKELTK